MNPKESEEQSAYFDWLAKAHPREARWIHAIPNGGSRHPAEARNLKRQGVKKGVSDIFVPYARHGKHGLYIEMKRRKGGRLRPEQRDFINDMTEEGYAAAVCYGAADAIKATEEYMGWTRGRGKKARM